MSTEVASLFAKIGADMSGLTNGLSQAKSSLDASSAGFSGLSNTLSSGLTVAAGVAAAGLAVLGGALAFSVAEAMEAQAVQSQLAAVLKSTGGGAGVTAQVATDLANSLAEVTRFSDEAVLGGENMLLTFTGIGKDVFPDATRVMLDMSQALGQDLKSSSIQLGKALNSPKDGLTALTRVGVTFTSEQKNLVKSLQASGDMAGAQRVILEELQKEFGGSAEAAGQTFAGQLDILKNKLSNVGEAVGTSLLPIGEKLLRTWGPVFTDLAGAAGAFFTTLMSGDIGGAFDSLREFDSVRAIFNSIGVSGEKLSALGSTIEKAWGGALASFQNFPNDPVGAFSDMLYKLAYGTGIPAFADLGDAVITLTDSFTNMVAWMQGNLLPLLIQLWSTLADAGANSLKQLAGYWQGVLLPALMQFGGWVQGNIFPLLGQLWSWLATNIPAALQTLSAFWTGTLQPALAAFWSWVQGTVFPLLTQLWDWLATNIPVALQTLSNFWTGTLQPALAAFWSWVQGTVFPLLTQLWDWLATNIPAALQTLSTFWTNTLLPAIQAVWTWLSTVLFPFLTSLGNFFSAVFNKTIEALAGLWQKVLLPAITDVWSFLSKNVFPIFTAIGDYLSKTFQPVFEALSKFLSDTLMPALSSLYNDFLLAIKGVFEDISGAISGATTMLNDLATAIANLKLPDWLTPGSPTPFELGLRGISAALSEVAGQAMPALTASLNVGSAPLMAAGGGAGAGAGGTWNGNLIVQGASDPQETARAVVQHLQDRGIISRSLTR